MSKTIKYVEVVHQWEGKAIVRVDGSLTEVNLGVVYTDKKLKETGVKELFEKQENYPLNTIALEVIKNTDIETVYEMSVEEFTKSAKVVKVDEVTETQQA